MNKLTYSRIFSLLILPFFLLPSLAFAQGTPPGEGNPNPPTGEGNPQTTNVIVKIGNPFAIGDNLYAILKAIVNDVILPIGGLLCVLSFIYAGFMYVTASGNEAKIKNAHKILLYSAIGTAVLLGSWMLGEVVQNTINKVIQK